MENSNKIFKTTLLKIVFSFITIVGVYPCLGQDTIVTRSGQVILGNVTEVTTTEIKYRKIEIADGPVYIENKSAVEKIKYKNGYTDLFPETKPLPDAIKTTKKKDEADYREKTSLELIGKKYLYGDKIISEHQMHKMLLSLNNPEITEVVKEAKVAKGAQYIGFAGIPLAVLGGLAVAVSSAESVPEESVARKIGIGFLGSAAILMGTSIYFQINRKHKNAEAVRLYREKY